MDRYTSQLTIDTTKRIPYYTTVLPTEIPTEDIPFYYVTQGGDRWDSLYYKFYGTPSRWWVLAKANQLVNGSIAIPEGTTLFIPNI